MKKEFKLLFHYSYIYKKMFFKILVKKTFGIVESNDLSKSKPEKPQKELNIRSFHQVPIKNRLELKTLSRLLHDLVHRINFSSNS